jgi:hypothetical protein
MAYPFHDEERSTDAADCPTGIGISRVGYAIICCVLNFNEFYSGSKNNALSYIGDTAILKMDIRTPMLARFLTIFSRVLHIRTKNYYGDIGT